MSDRTTSSRRRFFGQAALSGVSAAIAGSTRLSAQSPSNTAGPMGADRMERAYALRMARAEINRDRSPVEHPNNGDEARYSNYIGNFSKTLLHNQFGEVSRDSYRSFLKAIESGNKADYDAILRGGSVRFKSPSATYNYQLLGCDQSQFSMPAAPAFASAETAGEMVELYWMALARDVPFNDYGSNETIGQAVAALNRLSDFRGPREGGAVTANTIFRHHNPGDLTGPFLSQFLLKPFAQGSLHIDQKQFSHMPGVEYMTDDGSWLEIQMGIGKGPGTASEGTARYMRNLRDLATYVHLDGSYSAAYNAAWMLLGWGDLARSAENPYVWSTSQEGYVNFGPPDALEYASRAAKPAFHSAWYQKYVVQRRLRPEAMAGRVHYMRAGAVGYPVHADLIQAPVLDLIASKYRSFFLPQAYSEGCPAHSSYPSGHATVLGASVTMLKAFFREDFVIPDPVVASADGLRLEPYRGPDLTIGGELNKLAANIATGRNAAGIHYRSDMVEGMKLGEQVAIAILQDIISMYMDDFGGFHFTLFDGTPVLIH